MAGSQASARTRPNLLFVFGDEHRGQAVGCARNSDVRTPVIDGLAAEGVYVRHAYANTPVCTPCRGTLLTGQWPLRHGAVSNDLPVRTGPEVPSIARSLSAAGYRCGYVGKWHIGGWPRDRFTPPGPARLGFDDFWAAWECHHEYMVPKYHLNDSPDPIILRDRYEPEVQTDLALAWLASKLDGEAPFCLFLSYGPPHGPYRPVPPGFEHAYDPGALSVRPNCADTPAERRDLADYYAHATAVDVQIGRLVDHLRERGALDDTLVVYTSDHGTMLGSQGHHNKQQPWDESINVPLVMRLGDRLPRGDRPDLLISALEYAPTLLGLLGVEVPGAMEGRNLAAHLTRTTDEPAPESVYIGEMVCCDQAVRERLVPWRGVRTKRHTYARSIDGPWVLYDDEADPYQLTNLVEDSTVRDPLEAELQRWLARMEDEIVPANELLARVELTEAWAAREAHFHPYGWPPTAP
ncbi:MAG TPA: sulfatase [Chloroflexota bacterium]|nr:sulfatase [Chloroflexota bacterium]